MYWHAKLHHYMYMCIHVYTYMYMYNVYSIYYVSVIPCVRPPDCLSALPTVGSGEGAAVGVEVGVSEEVGVGVGVDVGVVTDEDMATGRESWVEPLSMCITLRLIEN